MRLIIEARLADGDFDMVEHGEGVLAVVDRPDCCLAELGLTLAEERSLLVKVQTELISKQVQRWLSGQTHCREGYEFNTLWWNLNTVSSYLKNNGRTLVNYGARHRKVLPISSSIAESAVDQIVSHRMAKKRQMRWTDEGAHCMAQVETAESATMP